MRYDLGDQYDIGNSPLLRGTNYRISLLTMENSNDDVTEKIIVNFNKIV